MYDKKKQKNHDSHLPTNTKQNQSFSPYNNEISSFFLKKVKGCMACDNQTSPRAVSYCVLSWNPVTDLSPLAATVTRAGWLDWGPIAEHDLAQLRGFSA